MGNIITYLKWRGDLTFLERPFSEVDNLVLSELSYLDLSGIVPATDEKKSISLLEASVLFKEKERKNMYADGPPEDFLSIMATSNRYREVKLSHFADVLDETSQTEFSALHIELGDGTVYVAFRGTNDSLMGWREDFSMSFQLMPSQKLAAEYLEKTMSDNLQYRVGGHSKGGNLAVYASMVCPTEKQEQIIEVYSNDGPGLCEELVDMEQYRKLQPKIIRIVPEFSVIGSLFEHEAPTKIVASSASGFLQHEGLSWQVEGDHFSTCEVLSKECKFYNQIFDQWIESADMEQRKTFTKDLFDALESGGAKRCSDLSRSGFEGFEAILLSVIQSESRTKIVIGKFIKSFFTAFASVQFIELFKEKRMIQWLAFFLLGVVLLIAPEFAAQCVGAGLGVVGVFWLGRKQYDIAFGEQQTAPRARSRLILNMVLMCGIVFLIAQKSLLLRFSNLLMGGCFLFSAYRWAKKAFDRHMPLGSRIANLALAVVAFLMGMVPIVTTGLTLWRYVFTAGSFIVVYGVGKIVHVMYENGKKNAH